MEYIHVIGKILRPKGFIFTRYPGGTTPGSLVRELAPQRLRELLSAAVQPKRCSKTKGVAFGRSATKTLQQNQRSCLRSQYFPVLRFYPRPGEAQYPADL